MGGKAKRPRQFTCLTCGSTFIRSGQGCRVYKYCGAECCTVGRRRPLTVDGTKLCPLCCGTGYTGNVNDREACERCEGSGIDGYAGKLAALEAERDEARAEVERLKEERLGVERALQTSHDNLDERWSELSEAHSRIAALEAVIAAQSEHAKAIARSNWTAFELSEALHAAGLDAEPVRGDSI